MRSEKNLPKASRPFDLWVSRVSESMRNKTQHESGKARFLALPARLGARSEGTLLSFGNLRGYCNTPLQMSMQLDKQTLEESRCANGHLLLGFHLQGSKRGHGALLGCSIRQVSCWSPELKFSLLRPPHPKRLGEGSPTKIDYRTKGTLFLSSLLEDLVDESNIQTEGPRKP